jgi:hypothetical protein
MGYKGRLEKGYLQHLLDFVTKLAARITSYFCGDRKASYLAQAVTKRFIEMQT